MMRSILVPLDGSEFSEQALPLAAELARRCDAALHLVKVHTLVIAGDAVAHYTALDIEPAPEIAAYLDGVAARLKGGQPIKITTGVLEGGISEAQETAIGNLHVDLVVMTSHGRGGLSRAWLGSVADELVRHAAAPVLLLRPAEGPVKRPVPSVLHRILVALEGTTLSESVLEPALELARAFGVPVTLARAVMPPPIYGLELAGYAPTVTDVQAAGKIRDAAADYLQRHVTALKERGIAATPLLLDAPNAAPAILDAAKKENCDLIAVATHGRGGLPRLVLGSVADKIIRGACGAVLVRRAATA
ncbi:MAG: universal stress protein [Gemmataceae bacterium]